MRILVVDDEFESRTMLSTILTAEGYQVRAADGGELALLSLEVSRPDVILLDIRMPGMDGFEVCRRLKENVDTRDIPLIFISASGDLAERVQGFRWGAVDFVTKPFQREELIARVRTHIELSRLRSHLEMQVAERTAELRESEERFRTMANAAPVMIWASSNRMYTFFNTRWLEFTGRTLEEELGNGWAEDVHPDDRERCITIYSESCDEGRAFEIEYRLRRADGQYRWVLDRGVPRRASSGAFVGYVGSCTDITELKQNHERLLATQKLESLGVMAAGVAHDFGNLLATIGMETESALSEMPPDVPGRESVERIGAVVSWTREVVNMLMVSAGGGVDPDALESADVSSLVEQVLPLMTLSISKLAVLRNGLSKNLPPVVGSSAQIRQVVMNLIANASDALNNKQGLITVTTEKVHLGPSDAACKSADLPEGEYVRLKVVDTGCGMDAETRARIFDPFFTTKSLGRGLGLAAVQGIVRSLGGAINVVSAAGAGTTFEVLFRCASGATRTCVATASGWEWPA